MQCGVDFGASMYPSKVGVCSQRDLDCNQLKCFHMWFFGFYEVALTWALKTSLWPFYRIWKCHLWQFQYH
jgi:hypothetical protein